MGPRKFSVQINVFKNRESPEQVGKTDLLREQLPSSGARLAAVL